MHDSAIPRTLPTRVISAYIDACRRIPEDLIQLLARISIAATFWLSGQTKIDGFVLDPIGLKAQFGLPHLSDGAVELFRSEYALPLLPPDVAALMSATAEHVFPLLLLIGLGTRLSAGALLGMTLVIEIFVYPAAWPTHGLWAALMLYLMARGPGRISIDRLIAIRGAAGAKRSGLAAATR
ncbi:DoxX family protein [Thermomonas sp.]|uniref:DoxX family protein n=1 Tax=Thermomonas sp. TaxID=1971895 RepID=UPI0024897A6D|nr:DoxX family protein [Thermomonas sp.]MDI1252697.1 DoxX family protein [Thermomonas sp.]